MGLEEIEERRGRGGVFGGATGRRGEDRLRDRAGADQGRLRLERTDEPEPHARGDDPARHEEQMKPRGLVLGGAEAARGARPRRARGAPRGRRAAPRPRAPGRRARAPIAAPEQRPPLRAARPVRDVPGRGGVAAGVQLGEPLRRAQRGDDERERERAGLPERLLDEPVEPARGRGSARAARPPPARRSGRSRRWGTRSPRAERRARASSEQEVALRQGRVARPARSAGARRRRAPRTSPDRPPSAAARR